MWLDNNRQDYPAYGSVLKISTSKIFEVLSEWGPKMQLRVIRVLGVVLFCVSLPGCGTDLLWWPGFNPIGTAYVDTIPVRSVATEVQCEIYKFLDAESDRKELPLLDASKGATVSLILQTDLSGSVQYVGVDLSKLGLPDLATLVSASNKAPTLQAKATGKTTISAEVDFVVAQSRTGPKDVASKTPPAALIKQSDMGSSYQNASFVPVKPGVFQAQPAASPPPTKSYFPTAHCERQNPLLHAYLQFWLDDWLSRYKIAHATYIEDDPFVCDTKVTLKSQFQIVVDVSAGVNAFSTPPIILPISGFNVDASPDYSHTLQVSFALKDNDPKHAAYCSGLQGSQPAQVNRN